MDALKTELITGLYSDETKELLKTDPNVMIDAIKADNSSFTLFAKDLEVLPNEVVEFYINYLCKDYHGDYHYYYTLRILHLLLKDANNIKLFHNRYIDEQFILSALLANNDIQKIIPNKVKFFTSSTIPYMFLRVVFKWIRLLQAQIL